jgi:bacillolysin
MGSAFNSIHFNAISRPDKDVIAAGARPMAMRGAAPVPQDVAAALSNDESAARFYLNNILQGDHRPTVRGLTAPDQPKMVPDLKILDAKTSELTKNSVVRFVQIKADVPIFGSHAVVEMDAKRELLGVDAQLTQVGDIPHLTALSQTQALEKIVEFTQPENAIDPNAVKSPALMYFHDDKEQKWHLVWYFKSVPAAPKKHLAGLKSHGPLSAVPPLKLSLDYLIDAHDGRIVLYWSSSPTMAMPVECAGKDEEGQQRIFLGEQGPDRTFILSDPMAKIKTFDLHGADIVADQEKPPLPLASASSTFDAPAAVSAHFNARRVHDFLKSVLQRNGIDDAGMQLKSYVNCIYRQHQPGPEWKNAVWSDRQMWYGQTRENGKLRSMARHLDIIAHELTHGITEFTANLMYYREAGALNESFSDIFGIIIKNWDPGQPQTGGSVAIWNWEIGTGLGQGGLPLRDFSDPIRTGDPGHMKNFLDTDADNGGVHTNSNIHNKAVYNVLTAQKPDGTYVFTPKNVALLYYLTLGRLGTMATFQETLKTLLNVAEILFSGSDDSAAKLAAITKAYADVGIVFEGEQ